MCLCYLYLFDHVVCGLSCVACMCVCVTGRNLRFEAGWANSFGLTFDETLAAVTSNVVDMFMINPQNAANNAVGEIRVGAVANFAAFDDDPFSLKSHVQLVTFGSYVHCKPQQR